MILIKTQNIYSQLSDYDEELVDKLSVYHKNYWFSSKYKDGLWDGKTNFLKLQTLKFPTGLLSIVTEHFDEKGIEYEVKEIDDSFEDNIFVIKNSMLSGIQLRDYQLSAIHSALNNARGILQLPTGSGKTEIAVGIIKLLNKKTLYVVHTKDLLNQTIKRFKQRLDTSSNTLGQIGDGNYFPNDITVATVQSLNSLFKKDFEQAKNLLNTFECLILDECHHASAQTWYKVAMFCHNASWRFGFSGTPLQRNALENMKLQACTGNLIFKLPTSELIKRKELSEIEVTMVDLSDFPVPLGETWRQIYRSGIVENISRNMLIKNIAKKHYIQKDKVMILVREIDHGNTLQMMLQAEHIPCRFVYGKHKSDYREESKEEFNESGAFVLIASPIFDEGVDLPEINTLILAPGGESTVKTLQRVGRGLRKKKDDSVLKVYDFLDQAKYISNHSLQREEIYKDEGFPVIRIKIDL